MAFARSGALRSGEQRFAAAVRIISIMLFAGEGRGYYKIKRKGYFSLSHIMGIAFEILEE